MILAAALEAKDELTDEDWDEMLNLRAKTNAGLSRTVEKGIYLDLVHHVTK